MQSIQKTITRLVVLSVVGTLIVGLFFIDHIVSGWLSEQFDEVLESKARALMTLTETNGVAIELEFADEYMLEYSSSTNAAYFELFLADGTLVERSKSYARFPDSVFHYPGPTLVRKDLQLPDGRAGRQVTIKFIPRFDDQVDETLSSVNKPGEAIVRVSIERESLDRVLTQLHTLIIVTGLVIVLLIMVGVWNSIKISLKPLIRIRNEISLISPEAIDRRLDSDDQPSELAPIAMQFNCALSEIDKAFQRERQFSADIAHELRTPVSELLALAEVGLRWPEEKEVSTYFGDIHESAARLDRLVSNLLSLYSSDVGSLYIQISATSLSDIIEKIGSNPAMQYKRLKLEYSHQHAPVLLTDPGWFELLLQNLLSNAISHSPDNSIISIKIDTQHDRTSIEIENAMIDSLSEENLSHIFDRFWRKDSARTSRSHVGIGLSLVKSYADSLDIDIEPMITSGNHFCIRLSNIKTAS